MILIFGTTIALSIVFHNKSEKTKERVLHVTAVLVISIYIFDFFVQPFWNDGEMAIHKLPFHICTLLGILIPFVNFNPKFSFAKQAVTVWAVLAPLMFILLPLNYINRPVQPYSYSVIQTFLFHGLAFFWGVFMLVSQKTVLRWQDIWQPIVGLFPVVLWATIGQEMYYHGRVGENFLFLRTDISAYVPQWLLVPGLLFLASCAIALLYLICYLGTKICAHAQSQKQCK